MNARVVAALLVPAVLAAGQPCLAHQPVFSDGSAVNADSALELVDVQVSRVVYHEAGPESPEMWLTFVVEQPQELTLQLGVPLIERLRDYRPVVALLGPGLPEASPGVDVPDGLGSVVIQAAPLDEREVFDEPFTGTSSWILADTKIFLPSAGRYYVVAYSESAAPGKLWVALGKREVFGFADVLGFSQVVAEVRVFHEVPAAVGLPCFVLPLAGTLGVLMLAVANTGRRPKLQDLLADSGRLS